MGMELTTYIGPYFKVPFVKVPEIKVIHGCTNKPCDLFAKNTINKFCSSCGTQVNPIETMADVELDIWDIWNRDLLKTFEEDEFNIRRQEDGCLVLANYFKYQVNVGDDCKEIEIDKLLMDKKVCDFVTAYEEQLKEIGSFYKTIIEVKFGSVQYWS